MLVENIFYSSEIGEEYEDEASESSKVGSGSKTGTGANSDVSSKTGGNSVNEKPAPERTENHKDKVISASVE